jgi:hypothetical protein
MCLIFGSPHNASYTGKMAPPSMPNITFTFCRSRDSNSACAPDILVIFYRFSSPATILSSTQENTANFKVDFSEVSLGESKNKYPTIPAIEVTIPHFSFLLNTTLPNLTNVNIKSLRCLQNSLTLFPLQV